MKKKTKRVASVISVLVALVIIVAFVFYMNIKNFTVRKVLMSNQQEVYLMGTFHRDHFKRYANYSVEEILNAINNIEPDAIFIEAREDSFREYGVVDGPIDMCVIYSYCMEHNIPVEMIDYWKIDNNFKENTTNPFRDDKIHENIMKKLNSYKDEKILVVCGFGHLNAQTERLLEAGGKKEKIAHRASIFKSQTSDFSYPGTVCDVWKKRVLFYGHTVPKLVHEDDTISDEMKATWVEDTNNSYYDMQMKYCVLFQNNGLYLE